MLPPPSRSLILAQRADPLLAPPNRRSGLAGVLHRLCVLSQSLDPPRRRAAALTSSPSFRPSSCPHPRLRLPSPAPFADSKTAGSSVSSRTVRPRSSGTMPTRQSSSRVRPHPDPPARRSDKSLILSLPPLQRSRASSRRSPSSRRQRCAMSLSSGSARARDGDEPLNPSLARPSEPLHRRHRLIP